MDFQKQLRDHIEASYPALWVVTWEEGRVDAMLDRIYEELQKCVKARRSARMKRVVHWSVSRGWEETWPVKPKTKQRAYPKMSLDDALAKALGEEAGLLLVVRDPDLFALTKEATLVRRLIRDCCRLFPAVAKTLVFVSPDGQVPQDLVREATVLRCPLPDEHDLADVLEAMIAASETVIEPDRAAAVVAAARGLTTAEAENVFALSMVRRGAYNPDEVAREKARLIARIPALSLWDPRTLPEVGGLSALMEWLDRRAVLLDPAAQEAGLPMLRGLGLVGPPGVGKSLVAKSVARRWNLPLVRFNVGATMSGMVGSSEEGMRRALDLSDVLAPAVLWIDEADKAFGGVAGSIAGLDSGAKAAVVAEFITWMQERTRPVFVVVTLNDVRGVPAELLRKGRLDEVFFLDLPVKAERQQVLWIHTGLRRMGLTAHVLAPVAEATSGFSGAELEAVVEEAQIEAYRDGKRAVSVQDLLDAVFATQPLARMVPEETERLRSWARGRARRATSLKDGEPVKVGPLTFGTSGPNGNGG